MILHILVCTHHCTIVFPVPRHDHHYHQHRTQHDHHYNHYHSWPCRFKAILVQHSPLSLQVLVMPINECPSFCLARSSACFGISLIHLCVIVVICETMSGKDHGTCPKMVGHLLSLHMYGWIPCAGMMILALLLTFCDGDCDPCADIMFNVAWAFLVLVYIAWWLAAVALFTVVLILMLIYSVIIIGAFIVAPVWLYGSWRRDKTMSDSEYWRLVLRISAVERDLGELMGQQDSAGVSEEQRLEPRISTVERDRDFRELIRDQIREFFLDCNLTRDACRQQRPHAHARCRPDTIGAPDLGMC